MSYERYTVTIYGEGSVFREEWRDANNNFHRSNGPAIIHSNGTKQWFKRGLAHREDGPAIERHDGSNFWYKNGLLHREDGPAIEHKKGQCYWYINGKEMTEEEFNNNRPKELTMDELNAILGYKVKIVEAKS